MPSRSSASTQSWAPWGTTGSSVAIQRSAVGVVDPLDNGEDRAARAGGTPPRERRRAAAPPSPPRAGPRRPAAGRARGAAPGPSRRGSRSSSSTRYSWKRAWQRIVSPPGAHATGRCAARSEASRSPPSVRPSAAARTGVTVVQDRRLDQEVAVVGAQLGEHLRGQVAVQRVGLAAHARHVLRRAPGLEEHAGDPAAGRLDDARRVGLALADLGQRLRRPRRAVKVRSSSPIAAIAPVDGRSADRPRGTSRRLISTARSGLWRVAEQRVDQLPRLARLARGAPCRRARGRPAESPSASASRPAASTCPRPADSAWATTPRTCGATRASEASR